MNLLFNDGLPITLEQMLNAKEQRVNRQQQYLDKYHHPIISLTLVIPGPMKNTSGSRYLFDEAIMTICDYFKKINISPITLSKQSLVTGPEAIIVFDCLANELKQHCITIEESHPLGRLWDIDVIDPITRIGLSRNQFTQQLRQCLVCENVAKVCGRSRAHSINEILLNISHKVNEYLRSA